MKTIPSFTTEAEEATWLYEHREELAEQMVRQLRDGESGEGTASRLARMRTGVAEQPAINVAGLTK